MTIRYFKSREKGIKVALNDGSEEIPVPNFVNGARKRFSYNMDTGMLSKQCSNCLKWFPVAQLTKEGVWKDIHDEKEIHSTQKAYRSDCNDCYQQKRIKKAGNDGKLPSSDKPVNSGKLSNSEPQKVSVSLYPEDRRYLKMCAGYLGITVGRLLAELIDKDRKERKIDY